MKHRIVVWSTIFSFSFFSLNILGGCFQPADGINLWRMVAQLGECVDVYGESILDELEVLLCAIGKVTPVVQTDFAPDLTITQPGYYKVCENITVPSRTLIISSNDVIVDLGHYFLDGVTILITNGFKNITIKNGLMRNRNRFINIGSSTQNITVEQMVFEDNVAGAPFGIGAPAGGPINGVTIRDVSFFNAAPRCIMLTGLLGNIISNIVIENVRCVSTNQALTATLGTDATIKLAFCDTDEINNVVVTDPFKDLDCIFLDTCEGVVMDTIEITSTLSSSLVAIGVRLNECNDIEHDNVSVFGRAFAQGFQALGGVPGSSHLTYNACSATDTNTLGFGWNSVTDLKCSNCVATECANDTGMDLITGFNVAFDNCDTSNNAGRGIRILLTNNVTMTGHTAINNGGEGILFSGCTGSTLQDCFVSQNGITGINIIASSAFVLNNIFAASNTQQGILIDGGSNFVVRDSTFIFNTTQGLRCSIVDNVVLSGCEAQNNLAEGFYFEGVNGGTIPTSAIDDIIGRSPLAIEGCNATQNGVLSGSTGFYMTNVGGVRVADCVATYNGGRGFHCDTGSWNVDVSDCVALSNGLNGFTTWDNTIGVQTVSRFHACHAARNRTTAGYIPILSDYTQNNTLATPMATPICGPVTSAQAFAPDPFSVVPPDFSTAG